MRREPQEMGHSNKEIREPTEPPSSQQVHCPHIPNQPHLKRKPGNHIQGTMKVQRNQLATQKCAHKKQLLRPRPCRMEKDPLPNPEAYPNKHLLHNPKAHPNPHKLLLDRPPMTSHPTREHLATMLHREHPKTPLCNLSKVPPASCCKAPHQPRDLHPSQADMLCTSRHPLAQTYPVTWKMQEDHPRMGMVEKDHPMAAGPQGEDPHTVGDHWGEEDPLTAVNHWEEEGLLTEEPQGGYPTMVQAVTHPPGGGGGDGRPPGGWGPILDAFPPNQGGNNHYHFHAGGNRQGNGNGNNGNCNQNRNNRKRLNIKSKLNLQKPKSFMGCDLKKWKTYITECVMTFSAKPPTYAQPYLRVTFAASYLKEVTLNNNTAHLMYNPNHPMFTDWEAFLYKFSTKFGIPNT
ncbi:hypothetical protein DXG01_004390 [Tephrocybe rancida]|nr:hypothetical protein DXG01_004390 [Tephrocybe rancida]